MAVISINELNKYIKGAILPPDIFMKMQKALLDGKDTINVPSSLLKQLEAKAKGQSERDKKLNTVVANNNKGIELEKKGKIKEAITIYESNIEIDYPAHHSFKRLMVLYRKTKDYDNEFRVIERAIVVFGELPEYVERLDKVWALIDKRK